MGQSLGFHHASKDYPETIVSQPARLYRSMGWAFRVPFISIHSARGPGRAIPQVSAGDMKDSVDEEVLAVVPRLAEIHPLGMTEEPCRLMVQRGLPVLKTPHSQDDPKGPALGSHLVAKRGYGH